MVMGAPTVEVAKNYTNALNRGSQTAISPAEPLYHFTGGNTNMAATLARHGPNAYYGHIMMAAFDPRYGRERSLAQKEERPATRFPLAEERRQHERSELYNAPESIVQIIECKTTPLKTGLSVTCVWVN